MTRKHHEYESQDEAWQAAYLTEHWREHREPMWDEDGDGYPELVEVLPDRVVYTSFLGHGAQHVREVFPDGSSDIHVDRP